MVDFQDAFVAAGSVEVAAVVSVVLGYYHYAAGQTSVMPAFHWGLIVRYHPHQIVVTTDDTVASVVAHSPVAEQLTARHKRQTTRIR